MYGQGNIPDDWEGEYCCYAVEWPNSPKWHAVLRGVLTIPAQGRFWDKNTGIITEAQEVIKPTFDTNLHFEEVIMTCNSPELALIADAINNLALAQCCGTGSFSGRGSGGAGSSSPPLLTVTHDEIIADPTGNGYEDEEEFLNDKCAIANDIIEILKADLGKLAITNLFGMSHTSFAALIAITLATPIPIDDIIAIAALLLSIGSVIVVTTSLSLINDNAQELMCDLYNGTDAANSKALFMAHFGEYVIAGVADPVTAFACNTFMSYMLGPSVVNRLYYKDLTRIWTGGDCSNCEEVVCCNIFEEDAQGWEYTTEMPLSGTLTETGHVTWLEAGRLHLHSDASGGGVYAAMIKTDFDCLVGESDTQFVATFEATGYSYSIYIRMLVNDEWLDRVSDNMSNSSTTANEDITDLQGETITAVAIMISRATNADLDLVFNSIGIGCP